MRYKVGWFLPQQVMALTHLVPVVTQDDFIGISQDTTARLGEVTQPFHIIIDNRIIKNEQVVSLEMILQTMPQLQSQPLRWIIMILPDSLRHQAADMATQRAGTVQLMYVDSLVSAFAALRDVDASLNWDGQVSDFFVA